MVCRFIGEENLKLEGGRGAFYVAGNYLKAGKIQCRVTAEKIESANCEIIVDEYIK